MNSEQLIETAKALIVHKKGILAADESGNTIKTRFDSIGIASTEITRRDYRQMLFETEEIYSYISGIILFDETIRQASSDGDSLVSGAPGGQSVTKYLATCYIALGILRLTLSTCKAFLHSLVAPKGPAVTSFSLFLSLSSRMVIYLQQKVALSGSSISMLRR